MFRARSIYILIGVIALCTCIDPYSPKLKGYDALLVVDGLITDADTVCIVKLSRTIQDQNATPLNVTDATVSFTDDAGSISYLNNTGKGIYQINGSDFKGIVGRAYVLHIQTSDGEEYESDPCLMEPVTEIDSLYYFKDQELVNNSTEKQDGIRIYLVSKGVDNNRYYRWDYEETWKFEVPSPKRYDYINEYTIVSDTIYKQYCWKSRKSDEVLIHSTYSGEGAGIIKEPLYFIPSDKSDRLMLQYSVSVKQYSISQKEYDFWNDMKHINESGGDIFAKQPFPIISNIHNVNNPKEKVLGYFQVSAVRQKRINILFSDIYLLNLPFYHNSCERIETSPQDPPFSLMSPPPTFDEINQMLTSVGYYFVGPKYNGDTGELEKIIFAKPECADCELTGTSIKPDFWTDLRK